MAPHERVLARTKRDGECLLWLGARNPQGYGQISVVVGGGRKNVAVHRVVFEAQEGSIPDGFEIDHKCRVRNCVELSHLDAVTHKENIQRTWRDRTECRHGHPLDESNLIIIHRRGQRQTRCRACKNVQNTAYKRRKRGRNG